MLFCRNGRRKSFSGEPVESNKTVSYVFKKDEDGFIFNSECYFSFTPSDTACYEAEIKSPKDRKVRLDIRAANGSFIGDVYYNKYTGEQCGIVRPEANKKNYFVLSCLGCENLRNYGQKEQL